MSGTRETDSAAVKMRGGELAAVLRDMAERIEARDSFDGNLTYFATDEADVFDVNGAYRIGNLQGQGGWRLIRRNTTGDSK